MNKKTKKEEVFFDTRSQELYMETFENLKKEGDSFALTISISEKENGKLSGVILKKGSTITAIKVLAEVLKDNKEMRKIIEIALSVS